MYPTRVSTPGFSAFFGDAVPKASDLALPLEIQAGAWPHIFRGIIALVVGGLALFIVLAALAPLRETATVSGAIIPEAQILPVQHLEGGIVSRIFVKPGDVVEGGAPLIMMEPVGARSDSDQLAARKANLVASSIRLNSLLHGTPPDFAEAGASDSDAVVRQHALYQQELDSLKKTQQLYMSRISQKAAEVASAKSQMVSLQLQIDARAEREQMNRELMRNQLTSKTILLDSKVQLEQAHLQMAQLQGQVEVGQSAMAEIENELADAVSSKRVAWSLELSKVSADIAEAVPMIAKLSDRMERLYVRAPVRAQVHSVTPKSVGDVLKPGEQAVELVPLTGKLVAEIKIRPDDIGYVRPGRPARVKLTAFDSEVFGTIDATVVSVSPTSFENERGEPYFKGVLQLSKSELIHGSEKHEILPGMVVRADVITGEKSILKYMLKPIFRSFDRAFSER